MNQGKQEIISIMKKNLKVLRVEEMLHQVAKINAIKKGVKLQTYIEQLIQADEKGLINWEGLHNSE